MNDEPVDWVNFAAYHWGKGPVVLPGGRSVDPQRVHEVITAASAPFHAGTRVRAMPDVRFLTTRGRLPAPGSLLPTPADGDTESYLARLRTELPAEGALLTVRHPLLIDFGLWSRVRELLAGLWQQVGWPAVPVAAELTVGERYVRTSGAPGPAGAAHLTWVLTGAMTVRVWQDPDREWSEFAVRAGELMYLPDGYRFADQYGDGVTTLRITVPARQTAALATVQDLLAERAQRQPEFAAGPAFLPFPAPTAPDGSVRSAEPLPATARLVGQLAHGPELERTLRNRWAARRSAAGLEPVPPPRAARDLGPGQRFRVTAEIFRMADGPGSAVWAINGHLLPVAGAAGERIPAALPPGRETTVDDLARVLEVPPDSEGLRALTRALYRTRAIEPLEGAAP
ncbi:hypothetical protein [Streptomyces sp. NBC_01766]|uniref:hypothetical protein n=1 Tax=Streptomyces sp. NBC_01766 TaxID=2975936 RepID=UPI002DDB75A3|nr:hypothetical protein [Streptomyces sp. NBC_01766]WSC18776.1 hypothetical protein OIE60_03390 [Streptomyces sp. NBC_01766]